MNEGWTCPVCRRGVAPSERHCDHGGVVTLPKPTQDQEEYLRKLLDRTRYQYPREQLIGCACGPGVACGNVACPRAMKVTCGVFHGGTAAGILMNNGGSA